MKLHFAIRGAIFAQATQHLLDLPAGTPLELHREPTNRWDHNAVRVSEGGRVVGYVAKEAARHLSPAMAKAGKETMPAVYAPTVDDRDFTFAGYVIADELPMEDFTYLELR